MFETIVEPILFGLKSNQCASRLAVTRNNDFPCLRLAKITGQIVLKALWLCDYDFSFSLAYRKKIARLGLGTLCFMTDTRLRTAYRAS
jgi:hypothetical protein